MNKLKQKYRLLKLQKIVIVSVLIGFLSAFLGLALKRLTEHYEEFFSHQASINPFYYIVFPAFGLWIIYFLRRFLFKKKENKGIREILESTNSKTKNLPRYKISSHFVNGLLTVIFGGSTGIEVSTVVATATIGSVAHSKQNIFRAYKTELICAGIAAGITALFSSPVAGILFALEVISRKITKVFLMSTVLAVLTAFGLIFLLDEQPLFAIQATQWSIKALPYFVLLGILSGFISVYLTRCVLFFKSQFTKINAQHHKIIIGSSILSISLLLFPQLYGDGYHSIKALIAYHNELPLSLSLGISFIGILILKPIVTSATLVSGGDGGVFAPSLFIGAFMGLLLALCINRYLAAPVIALNFIIIGMAAVLSASIHAPFTALFLVCGLTNSYTLFLPLMAACLISNYTAKIIYPFTVYSYATNLSK